MDGFQIEVPITIKGGREGERVGTQIGEKLAGQLQKAFRSLNISSGEGKQTGISGSFKITALKLGAISAALGATIGILRKSSPYLKGILDIFGRAFMMFFRPFGDFLATLLRPLAILMMKMAVSFIKFAQTPEGKAIVGTAVVIGGIVAAAAIGTLAEQALAIAAIGKAASTATPLVSSFMSKLKLLTGLGLITVGLALAYDVLGKEGFDSTQLLETLAAGLALGLGAVVLGASVATGITIGIITVTAIIGWKVVSAQAAQSKAYDDLVPKGMKDIEYNAQTSRMTRQFEQDMDWFEKEFGVTSQDIVNQRNATNSNIQTLDLFYNESTGTFEKISGASKENNLKMSIDWEKNLKDSLTNAGIYSTNINSTFDSIDKNILTVHEIRTVYTEKGKSSAPKGGTSGGVISKILNFLGIGGYATGTPFVPETGLYQLHRGEQVIPKTKVGQKNMNFRPIFNITGNVSKDIDIDAIVRRAGRMTEMELKQRGII